MNSRLHTTENLKAAAQSLGFSLVGACPAVTPTGINHLHTWLEAGFAGEMEYLSARAEAYEHPRHVLEGVRSLLLLTMNYRSAAPRAAQPGEGRVSRYAWGEQDYHDIIHEKLKSLLAIHAKLLPNERARGVVDTAPLLEREFAQLAGLGWIGKNTLLLNKQQGSYFFLAALLTTAELEYDAPHATDHCGTCTACLDACPTDAFTQPYVLNAARCISYLTIELRSALPHNLRAGVGDWVFGCDVCQDVCPWNNRAPQATELRFSPREDLYPLELIPLFSLSDDEFRARFRATPLWRSRRRGLLRNAAIALGNRPTPNALPALLHALGDAEPLVRGAAAWALGNYPFPETAPALKGRIANENDNAVRHEIEAALHQLGIE